MVPAPYMDTDSQFLHVIDFQNMFTHFIGISQGLPPMWHLLPLFLSISSIQVNPRCYKCKVTSYYLFFFSHTQPLYQRCLLLTTKRCVIIRAAQEATAPSFIYIFLEMFIFSLWGQTPRVLDALPPPGYKWLSVIMTMDHTSENPLKLRVLRCVIHDKERHFPVSRNTSRCLDGFCG